MIQLDLEPREVELLREILDTALSDFRMEIADTDSLDYRQKLKDRKQVLIKVLENLKPAESPS